MPAPDLSRIAGSAKTPIGVASFRDLTAADIEVILHYWYFSGDEHLIFLGVDRAKLGTPEELRARLAAAASTGDADQKNFVFALTLDGRMVGFTSLHCYAPDTNYSHWHLTDPRVRACGISTAIYPHRIKLYFDVAPMTRLIHQTRTRNIGVNRMLDRYLPVALTQYVERPDRALPGEFHMRYVVREDIPRLFAVAAAIAQSRRRQAAM